VMNEPFSGGGENDGVDDLFLPADASAALGPATPPAPPGSSIAVLIGGAETTAHRRNRYMSTMRSRDVRMLRTFCNAPPATPPL
jgi:hypothetical protein